MLFNSLDFAIFLPIVFGLYWFACRGKRKWQNVLILISSYLFYGWWDARFLILILFSTLLDFTLGWQLGKSSSPRQRKLLLWTSILANLGLLGFFKYYNFFIDNFAAAFSIFGYQVEPYSLELILPVGISFYTFQTLSYTIDIYRGKLAPTKSLLEFSAFVSFFPQLVAGPIERAIDLLPQFGKERSFQYHQAADGARQILWGFVKKIIVGDNCAHAIYWMFDHPAEPESGELLLGAVLFAFRCYGDFSGYSDIAIGTARLFGFNLTQNFAFPYFSRDVAEFWRRWHISLSTWLRDYLYIPLGGNRGGKLFVARNIFLTFTICGFWHGPDWKFVVWGALNGLFIIPLIMLNRHRKHVEIVASNRSLPTLKEFFQILFTFLLIAISILFLRASSTSETMFIIVRMFQDPLSWFSLAIYAKYKYILLTLALFLAVEWNGRREQYGLANFAIKKPRWIRWGFYQVLTGLVVYYLFSRPEFEFVYFHF